MLIKARVLQSSYAPAGLVSFWAFLPRVLPDGFTQGYYPAPPWGCLTVK